MVTRPGTLDAFFLTEVREYDPLGIRHDDVVLDLGANIGSFTARARHVFHAERIIAVEPEPQNLRLLHANVGHLPGVDIIERAVVGAGGPLLLDLHLAHGMNKGSHSVRHRQGRTQITRVRTTPMSGLLAERPTVWKVDIETSEYDIPEIARPPEYVRAIAMELHIHRREYRVLADRLVRRLAESGFVLQNELKWHRPQTVGIWHRA